MTRDEFCPGAEYNRVLDMFYLIKNEPTTKNWTKSFCEIVKQNFNQARQYMPFTCFLVQND